jgi:hypothetical protein
MMHLLARFPSVVFLLLSGMAVVSCQSVTLELESIPVNTPPGSSVFVSGNFNYWDPGDGNFRFQQGPNGKHYLEFPMGWGELHYKFTRGDWTSVEGDGCGHSISNREGFLGWLDWGRKDTIRHKIYSWEDLGPTDCDKVTFRIRKLPRETPEGDEVYLVGSFNDWAPGQSRYRFQPGPDGKTRYISLPKSNREIEFKLTRGSWENEEVDINGDRISNRKFRFGREDTVDLEIGGWIDLNPGLESRMVNFLVYTPMGTPSSDPVYIVGNFNQWKPGDPTYKMQKLGSNCFFIRFQKPEGEMEYKFTRGPWGMEEVDVYGNHISNRKLRTSADTVKITIPEWLDIPVDQTFTFSREDMGYLLNNPDIFAFPTDVQKGEKIVRFSLVPNFVKPTQIYIRVSLPSTPNNRNYGLVDLIRPGQEIKLVCPAGAIFYACDGPYWHDFRPKEKKMFEVTPAMEGVRIRDSRLLFP